MSVTGTGVGVALAAGAAQGMLSVLDGYPLPARVSLYGAPRPNHGEAPGDAPLIGTLELQKPSADVVDGMLVFRAPTLGALAVGAGAVVWARVTNGAGDWLFDARARMTTIADDPTDPAVFVVDAGAIDIGALLRITAGTLNVAG